MVISYCPHCQWQVPYVEEFLGREVFCVACGNHFILQGLVQEPEANCDASQIKPLVIRLDDPPDAENSSPTGN